MHLSSVGEGNKRDTSLANQSSSQELKGQARCVSSPVVAGSPMRSEGGSEESEQWGPQMCYKSAGTPRGSSNCDSVLASVSAPLIIIL